MTAPSQKMEQRGDDQRRRSQEGDRYSLTAPWIDCSVRNVSSAGELLEVESPLGTPRAFTLVVPADAETETRVSRRLDQGDAILGVEFKNEHG